MNAFDFAALLASVLLTFVCDAKKSAHGNVGIAPSPSGCPFKSLDIVSLLSSESMNTKANNDGKISSPDKQDNKLLLLKTFSSHDDHNEGCGVPINPTKTCNIGLYRKVDDSCNNLHHPTWGATGDCQLRFLPANYQGENGFQVSASGKPLPEPRDLSINIFRNLNHPASEVSHAFNIYGQFLAHDVVFTETVKSPTACFADPDPVSCIPIHLRENDPFYSKFNVSSLNFFARSVRCAPCQKGHKMDLLQAETTAVDLSLVYGRSEAEADDLRIKDGTGRLKFDKSPSGSLLPSDGGTCELFCPYPANTTYFKAGDRRVNQHSALSSMHAIFMREHNAMVKALKKINLHWGEEKLYQASRKILGAKMQNIAFKDYLPLLLGPVLMSRFDLQVKNDGSGTKYNASTRLGFWVEVSSAAFRLHSMVPSGIGTPGVRFRDTYSNPNQLREGLTSHLLNGASNVPAQMHDRYFVDDVSGYLLRPPQFPFGDDLVAVDIQRGRDHGVPFYVDMVKYITQGQLDIQCFDELAILMPPKNVELLKQNYESVADVELWVGMNLEKIFPGSVLGFTSAVLVAKQFYNLKYGDRFYFEHKNELVSFTPAQRESLKKTSLSQIFCRNLKLRRIKRNLFLFSDATNPEVSCNHLPDVDLTLWKTISK